MSYRYSPVSRKNRVAVVVPLLVMALVALGLSVGVVASPVSTAAPAAAATSAEPEAPDFASETYSDPWDYSNAQDFNTDAATVSNAVVSGGTLQFDSGRGASMNPVYSVPGALAYGRDGAALSIDTSRYRRLSFELNQTGTAQGVVYWFTCSDQLPSCAGGFTFTINSGDHVYDLDMTQASTVGANAPWSGRMVALRLVTANNITAGTSVHDTFNWMRLYAPSSASPHGAYPPGSYSGYTIGALPEPVIDSPSVADGQDLAQAQRGRPWNFTTYANAQGISVNNAVVQAYDSRGITATNTTNDPQIGLDISSFDANVYHNLTFDMTYDGPFSLASSPGGGKLARVVWFTSSSSIPQESNDMVTYSGANAGPISVNLAASNILDEDSRSPRLGWANNTITSLRFDPNEDPGANTWHVKSISLRADPAAIGATTVKFHDAAWESGTTADVLVGTGAPGSGGYTTIASGVAVQSGTNSVPFNLGSLPGGSYHVELILHHPSTGRGALTYDSTIINMTRDNSGDPKGSLDSVTRNVSGVTISGWAWDHDTNSTITVRTYVDGNFVTDTTTGGSRPDVASGVAGAPTNTGYSEVVQLGSGTHNVCTYGINVGNGNNSTLGCKQITVNTNPVGSFDVLTTTAGGIHVAGWALDPDTASPIAVHVYVGSTGTVLTANQSRPDIANAYPGYGAAHGFSSDIAVAAGTYSVCAYGINNGAGGNTQIGCKSVQIGGNPPVGSLDGATRVSGGVALNGWALDPDVSGSIPVHVYVNGAGAAVLSTTGNRPDVGAAYPGTGNAHGFTATVAAPAGATVCVYAIDNANAGNTTLGCRTL